MNVYVCVLVKNLYFCYMYQFMPNNLPLISIQVHAIDKDTKKNLLKRDLPTQYDHSSNIYINIQNHLLLAQSSGTKLPVFDNMIKIWSLNVFMYWPYIFTSNGLHDRDQYGDSPALKCIVSGWKYHVLCWFPTLHTGLSVYVSYWFYLLYNYCIIFSVIQS